MKKTGTVAQPQAHMTLKTTEFVTNNDMVIVPHPPYSLYLSPCD
jgi:hypothetical protein